MENFWQDVRYAVRSFRHSPIFAATVVFTLAPFNSDRQLVSMLADEARVSVWLSHPNIVQVFDFGKVGETYYIALEYLDGCDLCRMMRSKSRGTRALPLPTAP